MVDTIDQSIHEELTMNVYWYQLNHSKINQYCTRTYQTGNLFVHNQVFKLIMFCGIVYKYVEL